LGQTATSRPANHMSGSRLKAAIQLRARCNAQRGIPDIQAGRPAGGVELDRDRSGRDTGDGRIYDARRRSILCLQSRFILGNKRANLLRHVQ
jgi:hypothetical protein